MPTSGWIEFRWASRDLATINPVPDLGREPALPEGAKSCGQGKKRQWKRQTLLQLAQALRSRSAGLDLLGAPLQVWRKVNSETVERHHYVWLVISNPTHENFLPLFIAKVLKAKLVHPTTLPICQQ